MLPEQDLADFKEEIISEMDKANRQVKAAIVIIGLLQMVAQYIIFRLLVK